MNGCIKMFFKKHKKSWQIEEIGLKLLNSMIRIIKNALIILK